MIETKEEAIEYMKSDYVSFGIISDFLLKDRDVVRAFIINHSSNKLIQLDDKFPISINVAGMIDDERFVSDVINGLDVGFDNDSLMDVLKVSARQIVIKKLREQDIAGLDVTQSREELKKNIKEIVDGYMSLLKVRKEQLIKKEQVREDVFKVIDDTLFEDNEPKNCKKDNNDRYRRNKIGFNAEF